MAKDNDNTGWILLGATGLLFLAFSGKAKESVEQIIDDIKKPQSPSEFIKWYFPFALNAQRKTGVPAFFILALTGLESAWGKNAYGFNFSGIKANSAWPGQVQKLKTWECGKTGNKVTDGIKDEVIAVYPPGDPNGNASCNSKGYYSYRVYGLFRKYDNPEQSFIDLGMFLKNNSRYSKAFNYTDSISFGIEVAKAGYATAPNYQQVLTDTIKKVISLAG